MSVGAVRLISYGKACGKVSLMRRALLEELARSGHVHHLGHEGLWCVTQTRIGPLWELLPEFRGRRPSSGS